ncbi:hypothetical protein A500_16325 [Clostridium sartagoforme AAU1]|uniref:Uncharacterized protein n=1 Tax=Clostridium sartagoforme AAU1 TaxID=1202534 RepID=R9BTV4_9CLOT|nr:hypothetical protein [Clostridium sartagoforme]EOR20574.1 hypothetical protein A500_16325 [Clostridium sartagoforme AAU1]
MDSKYFLRLENNNFGFVVEGVHKILDTDISITLEDYNRFFELQNQGKQFRSKENPTGKGLFDYIEEYTLEVIEVPTKPTELERIAALEMALLEVL